MALTFEKASDGVHGHQRFWQGKITFDSSYPTGGEAIAASDFGLSFLTSLVLTPATIQHRVLWDSDNSKLQVVTDSLGSELANGGDASSVEAQIVVYGY